jgi:hypothetical protein
MAIGYTYLIPGLIAAGAIIAEWLAPERDPEWADKNVFNDRMRVMHSNILNANNALGACPAFMANKGNLDAWRSFRTNWSKYYADVGKLVLLQKPSAANVANIKLYSSQLLQWIDLLKTIPSCQPPVGPPPPLPIVKPDPISPPSPIPSQTFFSTLSPAATVGIGVGASVLLLIIFASARR